MLDYLLGEAEDMDITRQHGPNQSNVFHGIVDRDFRGITEKVIAHVKGKYEQPADQEILRMLYLQRDTAENTDTCLHLACR